MKSKVINLDNKAAGEIELSADVFAAAVRKDLLARMVNWQLAKRRAGTHKVKTRFWMSVPSFRQPISSPASSSTWSAPASARALPGP